MAIAENDKKGLVDELIKIMDHLKKNGLMNDNVDVKEVATKVVDTLAKENIDLTLDDAKNNPEKRNWLGMSAIAEANPNNKLNYVNLFKDNLELDPKSKEKLKLIYKALNKKNEKDPEKQKELEIKLNELDNLLKNRMRKEDQSDMAKQMLALEILTQDFKDPKDPHEIERRTQRIADYGVDTHNPGAVLETVFSVIGDQMNRMDLANTGESFKGKQHNPFTSDYDPLSTKAGAALLNLMTAVIDTPAEINLVNQLEKSEGLSLFKTPTNTPTPGS